MVTKLRLMGFWFFLICGTPLADAQTAQQIAKKAFDSTVLLIMEDANGQPVGLGSGFFVKPQQIATNLHVVEGSASGYAKLVGQKTKYEIVGVSAIDRKRDLAILNVAAFGGTGTPAGRQRYCFGRRNCLRCGKPARFGRDVFARNRQRCPNCWNGQVDPAYGSDLTG